jgi:hypothetical protein
MGWGDEIIASGQARLLYAQHKRKVVIRDRRGDIRAHEMWKNNPHIASRSEFINSENPVLVNGPGVRPYIASKVDTQWTWREWECPAGEIYFDPAETEFAARFEIDVLIEPSIKAKASPNKDWGRERWQSLTDALRAMGRQVFQVGPPGTIMMRGAKLIETQSFRHGCAVLARARAAILPEGGLHHAAAALGIPAVVLFGGFISPKQTGYPGQASIFTGGTACGMRIHCAHCKEAMAAITPEVVLEELARLKC